MPHRKPIHPANNKHYHEQKRIALAKFGSKPHHAPLETKSSGKKDPVKEKQ